MSRPYGDTSQLLPGRTSRAHRCARSRLISCGVQGRPSSAGRQSQVRRDARLGLPPVRKRREAQEEQGFVPHAGPHARSSRWPAGRCPTPCLPLRCPSPGRFLESPLGLSPSQQQPQCLTTKAPARQSPEMPTPVRAMSRRDPRYRAARPVGRLPRPNPHFPLPTAGTASSANLIFVVINFCGEGEKKKITIIITIVIII